MRYRQAETYMARNDYLDARVAAEKTWPLYRDAQSLERYADACYRLSQQEYDSAREIFASLGEYRDAPRMAYECDYQKALAALEDGDCDGAKALFLSLKDYEDAGSLAVECDYRKARAMLEQGECLEAKALFEALNDYKDAADWCLECDYRYGLSLLEQQKFDEAYTLYQRLSEAGYKDSDVMLRETDYQLACAMLALFETVEASEKKADTAIYILGIFDSLKDYKNAQELAQRTRAVIYDHGVYLFGYLIDAHNLDEYNYTIPVFMDEARAFFEIIPAYQDSALYLRTCDALREANLPRQFYALKELWDFQPAYELLISNVYICPLLYGNWREEGSDDFFGDFMMIINGGENQQLIYEAYYNFSDSYFYGDHWIAPGQFKIDRLVCYENHNGTWEAIIKFTILSPDIIEVYYYGYEKSYTLYIYERSRLNDLISKVE